MSDEHAPSLPDVSTVPSLPTPSQAEVLSLLFEPSPTLISRFTPLLSKQEFESYDSLISAVGYQLRELAESEDGQDRTALQDILSSHPRLGEKKVHSALSRMEQRAMEAASHTGPEPDEAKKLEEQETLRGLNEEYERTFPGLRYVVFVNGRPRPVIFEDMRKRITRDDIQAERNESIKAMCDIASDRARKLRQQT